MIQKSYTAPAGSPVSVPEPIDGILVERAVHASATEYPGAEYHLSEVRMVVTGGDQAQMTGDFSIRDSGRSVGRHSSQAVLSSVTIPAELVAAYQGGGGEVTMPWSAFKALLEGAFAASDPELSD